MTDQTNPTPTASEPSKENKMLGFIMMENLMTTFANQIEQIVDMRVEAKFNAMVENKRALSLMDDALEYRIEQKIIVAIAEHENAEAHYDRADIDVIAADQARETLKEYAERQEGWVTKDQVNDLITEHVDEELDKLDWDERVKDVLRDML
jgi:anion-transporting  ArsA/GET3 family ATPase